MGLDGNSVLCWLNQISSSLSPTDLLSQTQAPTTVPDPAKEPPQKRRRFGNSRRAVPLSPPRSTPRSKQAGSLSDSSLAPAPAPIETNVIAIATRMKRSRPHDGPNEADDIPEGAVDHPQTTPRLESHSTSSRRRLTKPTPSLASTAESCSGYSSPTKELSRMEIGPDGVSTRNMSLSAPDMPTSLRKMLLEMENFSRADGVVPKVLQKQIDKLRGKVGGFDAITRDYMYDNQDPVDEDHYRYRHCLDAVLEVTEQSSFCQDSHQMEDGWNNLVHSRLLTVALRDFPPKNGRMCLVPCTRAKITREYVSKSSVGKMIDYVLCINPLHSTMMQDEPEAAAAVDKVRGSADLGMINHTDHDGLRQLPLAVSIETKRRGENQTKAEAQMGTWLSAQWNFLARHTNEEMLDRLEFIPGLLVVGDEWKFVACSRLGGKKILWLERVIGSTSNELGTFQVLAAIRRLTTWAIEKYWPWYKKVILGIAPQSS
ncbi:hypothetical protein BDP81DRAFT_218238 [Colletotrichum phormii]|uniref:PD-(D/E)XK nuclease-like domain-containing protein n=1 Tax=Colletotrichum phormii TaxID=359342 RepID=A0AAI9ZRY8_9PEZI|nr:uncharacterized protein BDP81DRAFT_218238 [Colletotrichum phormii]KAK1637081.1 hypothetical protein BDP81DRAFT_218238 [Colletotrichum phormii]